MRIIAFLTGKGGGAARRLRRAALVGAGGQPHLLENERQWLDGGVPLEDRAAQHGGAEVHGAAILDAGPLHLQHQVLEGVELQEAVDDAVVAEAHRVPVGALARLGHDRAAADPAAHPPKDGVREDRPGGELQGPPAPRGEAVLGEEVGEVAPRPEGR